MKKIIILFIVLFGCVFANSYFFIVINSIHHLIGLVLSIADIFMLYFLRGEL